MISNTPSSLLISDIDKTIETVRQQKEAAEQTADNLRVELERLQAAIALLKGEKVAPIRSRPQNGNGSGKEKRKRRPGPKSPEVIEHVKGILAEEGALPERTIRSRISDSLKKLGRSQAGLHLTLPKALKGGPFVQKEGYWGLE